MSCWYVQPASPTGLTYTKPILSGSLFWADVGNASATAAAARTASALRRVVAEGAGDAWDLLGGGEASVRRAL